MITATPANDYCYASELLQNGLPDMIRLYYQNWFGRVTQVVGAGVFSLAPVEVFRWLPALLLAAWLLALVWAIWEIGKWRQRESAPVLTALLILYATLAGTPQIFHSLYWISGIFPYTFPLVLFTAAIALIVRTWRLGGSAPAVAVIFILTVVAGLASEQFALVQVAVFGLALLALIYGRRWSNSLVFAAGGVGAVGALVVLLAAPGNTYRQTLFEGVHQPVELATQSLIYAMGFVAASIASFSPGAAIAAALLPLHLLPMPGRASLRMAGLVLAVAFLLIVVFNVPAIYATALPPPARTYIIAQFVFISALVAASFFLGRLRPERWNAAIALLLLLVGPVYTSFTLVQQAANMASFASAWDAQDQAIRRAAAEGEGAISVAPLTLDLAQATGLKSLAGDPAYWLNECAARYYGVNALSAG